MENENKDKKTILTDEQLKEVAGGARPGSAGCMQYLNGEECVQQMLCKWSNGKCVSKLSQGLTNKNAIV